MLEYHNPLTTLLSTTTYVYNKSYCLDSIIIAISRTRLHKRNPFHGISSPLLPFGVIDIIVNLQFLLEQILITQILIKQVLIKQILIKQLNLQRCTYHNS